MQPPVRKGILKHKDKSALGTLLVIKTKRQGKFTQCSSEVG